MHNVEEKSREAAAVFSRLRQKCDKMDFLKAKQEIVLMRAQIMKRRGVSVLAVKS